MIFGASILPSINGNIGEIGSANNDSSYEKHSSIINESMLDVKFIYNITENLSYIIFTEYNESAGELAKGRVFGSKGEHKAAEILKENMSKLGLWTTFEQIQNIPEYPELTHDVDVQERGLTIYNKKSHSLTPVKDCFISSRWNFTALPILLQEMQDERPILGFIAKLVSSLIIPPKGFLDQKYNFYDKERLTHNFSYYNLEVIRKPTNYSLIRDLIRYIRNDDPFVYIVETKQETNFKGVLYKIIDRILDGYEEQVIWTLFHPNCKGLIVYDSKNDNTYNMDHWGDYAPLPTISVNGTVGKKILENPENYLIDFYINQSWNDSIISYNVIGLLNGTNADETVIVGCLYDCWWNQGTADSAIGMAMVFGIAKYFHDYNITPKCNVKFIGFSGEEYGALGAKYYDATHPDENITTVIDLNQLGFDQPDPVNNPRLTLNFVSNSLSLNTTVAKITNCTNYVERTGNVTDFRAINKSVWSALGNWHPFHYNKSRSCNTIFIVKNHGWVYHHRDGLNHTEGDVIDYFNWTDTSVTSEMIWNVTKYFTVNPNSWFENDSFTSIDSPDDEDDLNDSINATFTIKTSIPSDLVMVNASLIRGESEDVVVNKMVNYTANSDGVQNTITLTLPEQEEEGWYKCKLYLYNSTGRINEILHLKSNNVNDTSPPEVIYYYLYPYGQKTIV